MKLAGKMVAFAALALAVAFTSCKKDDDNTTIAVEKVEITTEAFDLEVGKTKKLEVVVTPTTATDKTVEFTTADDKIATVAADGTVTAVAEGKVIITATSKSDKTKKAEIEVTVVKATEEIAVEITTEPFELEVGKTQKLDIVVTPENTTNKEVEFSSADDKIATVSENGTVTAVAEGKVIITVTSKADNTKTATIEVTVVKAEEIAVEKIEIKTEPFELEVGKNQTLEIAITPENATNAEIEFTSSDNEIATVNDGGVVTAVAVGEATITATLKADKTKTAEVKVTVIAAK